MTHKSKITPESEDYHGAILIYDDDIWWCHLTLVL